MPHDGGKALPPHTFSFASRSSSASISSRVLKPFFAPSFFFFRFFAAVWLVS